VIQKEPEVSDAGAELFVLLYTVWFLEHFHAISEPCKCGSTSHARTSHRDCSLHTLSKREVMAETLGTMPAVFCRKIGLVKVCRIESLPAKINEAVVKVRNMTYQIHLLANRFLLSILEEGKPVPAEFFTLPFFYACAQLLNGTSPRNLPEDMLKNLDEVYTIYCTLHQWPRESYKGLMVTISACCQNSVKDAKLHICSNFERRAKAYFASRIRREIPAATSFSNLSIKKLAGYLYGRKSGSSSAWPIGIEIADDLLQGLNTIVDDTDLGPTPVTEAAISENPHLYLPFLFKVLNHFTKVTNYIHPDTSLMEPP